MSEIQPEKQTTLIDWGFGFLPDPSGAGVLVLQSPTGLERISWPMSPKTVETLRREMMGLAS